MQTLKFDVLGMICGSCTGSVQRAACIVHSARSMASVASTYR